MNREQGYRREHFVFTFCASLLVSTEQKPLSEGSAALCLGRRQDPCSDCSAYLDPKVLGRYSTYLWVQLEGSNGLMASVVSPKQPCRVSLFSRPSSSDGFDLGTFGGSVPHCRGCNKTVFSQLLQRPERIGDLLMT